MRVCVATDVVDILRLSEGAFSGCSRLGCPELRTELGRLALKDGDAAPESLGVAEPGLLSPTKLEMRLSRSRRLSGRAGVSYVSYDQHWHSTGFEGQGLPLKTPQCSVCSA